MAVSPRNKRRRLGVTEAPNLTKLVPPQLTELLKEETADDGLSKELKESGFNDDIIKAFKRNKIEHHHLYKLTHDTLRDMGIDAVGDQMNILKWIQSLPSANEKVFNDPIHGHIELHPLLVAIIDTPQFQRLRYIKQLGGGYYVFPGASHNRFEHSLGVSYLAGQFVESLQSRQVELNITHSDVLCVKVAGLCHDLGHGPFSHMFDIHFITKVPGADNNWKHEQGSVDMLDHLIKENNLWPTFEKYGLAPKDLIFMKELINGPLKRCNGDNKGVSPDWPYEGRDINKSFLYEIVANKRNGVDVDKWDYFARDCHCLGIPNSFDCRRYMKFARVIEVDGYKQICCRDKEVVNLYEMFHTRNVLHRRAYKHKTSQVVEVMLTEALLAANDHFLIPGRNGTLMKMSDAINDMVAYSKLNDSVIQLIGMSTDSNLSKAQSIIHDIERRHLYKCVGQTQPSANITDDEEEIKKQIMESSPNSTLSISDLHVEIATFDYGMKDKNPIDNMRFYTKSQPNKAVKVRRDQVSQMLPVTFKERNIRVYCKKLDTDSLDLALKSFVAWCNKQEHLMTPKGEIFQFDDSLEQDFTPYGTPFGTPAKHDDHDDQPTITITDHDLTPCNNARRKKIDFSGINN